jgi:hypothetical protein
MLHASEMEELLDAYGAKRNRKWGHFRALTATTKLFSDISYELLHIQHMLPSYQLQSTSHDFTKGTKAALTFASDILIQTSRQLLSKAEELSMPVSQSTLVDSYIEVLPEGQLQHDIESRKIDNVYETITLLATSFLNLVEESQILQNIDLPPDDQCLSFNSVFVNEENLRRLSQSFHNLQALYDTYVAETDVEESDGDLAVLRGHISIVFHLLKVATSFVHYYERHIRSQSRVRQVDSPVDAKKLLHLLINYSITFANSYITSARQLCHSMLKRYIESDEIEIAVPEYRGFHVRPSTLISQIVLHYGTDVKMVLDEEIYNAAVPLEIFRVNEKINAEKRCRLMMQISKLKLMPKTVKKQNLRDSIEKIILILAEQGDLIIYEKPLQLMEHFDDEEDVFLKHISNEIARLQAEAKIDIRINMKIKIVGDKRVLQGIRLLAESGYGEDSLGNNIPLPKELKYLHR